MKSFKDHIISAAKTEVEVTKMLASQKHTRRAIFWAKDADKVPTVEQILGISSGQQIVSSPSLYTAYEADLTVRVSTATAYFAWILSPSKLLILKYRGGEQMVIVDQKFKDVVRKLTDQVCEPAWEAKI